MNFLLLTKSLSKRFVLLFLLSIISSISFANTDFDSLGSTEAILKKSKALDPDNKIRVVQKRLVDRDLRFEFSGHYGFTQGGDAYVNTQTGGAQLEFHLNPQWSLGFRYDQYFNSLNLEGQKIYDQSNKNLSEGKTANTPAIDFPLQSQLYSVSWYPIYGKLNLFDKAISQFDLYLLAGIGSIKLDSGNNTQLTSLGGGVGLWMTQHLMARWELRYQGYKDNAYLDNPQMNQFVMHLSFGYLL